MMSAVVAVLNESLVESMKGFYKLRRAYMTLDSIVEMERKHMASIGSGATTAKNSKTNSKASSIDFERAKDVPGAFQDDPPTAIQTTNEASKPAADGRSRVSIVVNDGESWGGVEY